MVEGRPNSTQNTQQGQRAQSQNLRLGKQELLVLHVMLLLVRYPELLQPGSLSWRFLAAAQEW